MASDRPEVIPGQLDVYDCLEIAKSDGLGSQDRKTEGGAVSSMRPKPRPLTPAEVVARRLKETE